MVAKPGPVVRRRTASTGARVGAARSRPWCGLDRYGTDSPKRADRRVLTQRVIPAQPACRSHRRCYFEATCQSGSLGVRRRGSPGPPSLGDLPFESTRRFIVWAHEHVQDFPARRTHRCAGDHAAVLRVRDPNCGFLTLTTDKAAPEADDNLRRRWQDAPVPCALTAEDIGSRAEQWRGAVANAERQPIPDGFRLTVPIERLATVAGLAAAEQACCPFFDFRLHLDGAVLHVEVRTSAEGQPMLAAQFDPPVS